MPCSMNIFSRTDIFHIVQGRQKKTTASNKSFTKYQFFQLYFGKQLHLAEIK